MDFLAVAERPGVVKISPAAAVVSGGGSARGVAAPGAVAASARVVAVAVAPRRLVIAAAALLGRALAVLPGLRGEPVIDDAVAGLFLVGLGEAGVADLQAVAFRDDGILAGLLVVD